MRSLNTCAFGNCRMQRHRSLDPAKLQLLSASFHQTLSRVDRLRYILRMTSLRPFRTFIFTALAVLTTALAAHAQKGVDSQTQKIKDDGNKVTTRSSDATRSFDWGKGK